MCIKFIKLQALQILTNDDEVENWSLSSFLLAVKKHFKNLPIQHKFNPNSISNLISSLPLPSKQESKHPNLYCSADIWGSGISRGTNRNVVFLKKIQLQFYKYSIGIFLDPFEMVRNGFDCSWIISEYVHIIVPSIYPSLYILVLVLG